MKPLEDCKLYVFVDTAHLHGRGPEVAAQVSFLALEAPRVLFSFWVAK